MNGTILCLGRVSKILLVQVGTLSSSHPSFGLSSFFFFGRVLEAHDEQDDAEGERRDWEEDPIGFDTNPMLLRAMCMAFE